MSSLACHIHLTTQATPNLSSTTPNNPIHHTLSCCVLASTRTSKLCAKCLDVWHTFCVCESAPLALHLAPSTRNKFQFATIIRLVFSITDTLLATAGIRAIPNSAGSCSSASWDRCSALPLALTHQIVCIAVRIFDDLFIWLFLSTSLGHTHSHTSRLQMHCFTSGMCSLNLIYTTERCANCSTEDRFRLPLQIERVSNFIF